MSKSERADMPEENAPLAEPRLQAHLRGGEKDGDVTTVALQGELDLATVGVVDDALANVGTDVQTLVLDLRELNFLDSSGLRLILKLAAGFNGSKHLYVVRGPEQVDRVFEITGAAEHLNLIDDPSSLDAA